MPAPPRFAGDPPAPAARPTSGIRVATLNLWFGHRPDAAEALLRTEPALAGADLIALQEVDEGLAARLAHALGLGYVYHAGARHPRTGRHFGPALLSRWHRTADGCLTLPHAGIHRLPRVVTWACYDVDGHALTAHAVHFSTMREVLPRHQAAQAEATAQHAATWDGPAIIAGDLNRHGLGHLFLRHGWDWPTRRVGRTHHIWSFDHVFTRGLGAPRAVGSVASALRVGDHRAVWVDLPPA